jgi:hypothetical protein
MRPSDEFAMVNFYLNKFLDQEEYCAGILPKMAENRDDVLIRSYIQAQDRGTDYIESMTVEINKLRRK